MPPTSDPPHPGDDAAALSLTQFDAASELFRALAAPIRLAIVELLTRHHQLHVHQIVDAVGVPQALVSQHLRVLRQARIVLRVQTGRETVYRLTHPAAERIVTAALATRDDF